MTQEEYQREMEERQRLINQYNSLVAEFNRLVNERNQLAVELERSAYLAAAAVDNAAALATQIIPRMEKVSAMAEMCRDYSGQVLSAIKDAEDKYFLIKNISTASKKLTELDDIYQRKYRFYTTLRKITLGYIVGIDANIISNETLRKTVEENYLMNTEYWVSYAISAVMLWMSNEKEAAERALKKSLGLEEYKSFLFFMLLNLRFGRQDAARKWYSLYSKDIDIFNIGDEFEFILEAYLHHAFGNDKEFEEEVGAKFNELLSKMRESYSNYDRKVIDRVTRFAEKYAHNTDKSYDLLQETCLDYPKLLALLTKAEKEMELAKYYKKINDDKYADIVGLTMNIENVLYNLISAYDKDEYEIIKQIKYNEYIIKAKGDLKAAREMYATQIEEMEEKKTLDDLIFKFAFSDLRDRLDNKLRRFAISFLIDQIKEGYKIYHEKIAARTNDQYEFNIDGCKVTMNENNVNDARKEVANYYKKNKRKFLLRDKVYKTFMILSLVTLGLTLGLTALMATVIKNPFDKLGLTIAFVVLVIATIVFWILWWLRRAKTSRVIDQQRDESLKKLNEVINVFKTWKNDLNTELLNQDVLQETLDLFKKK